MLQAQQDCSMIHKFDFKVCDLCGIIISIIYHVSPTLIKVVMSLNLELFSFISFILLESVPVRRDNSSVIWPIFLHCPQWIYLLLVEVLCQQLLEISVERIDIYMYYKHIVAIHWYTIQLDLICILWDRWYLIMNNFYSILNP